MISGMNKKLYITLCSNFNKPKDKEHFELLEEIFKDEDPLLLERAIIKIIQEDKFFPSVARIKEALNEVWITPLTEEEKLKRWNKEDIVPVSTTKEPKEELVSEEELKELQEEWDLLFG